mmetsp:Transcript_79051/g.144148  ORF Transcript_79051/g.144148 Transcript_79051/m.144148 type:complete len:228 (+) Transcript_79051:425-1108(+)
MLHQMPSRVVCDDGVWHSMLPQLPGCQGSALVTRSRLVDPDVQPHTTVKRSIHRRQCRAPVCECQPASVAVREYIDFARTSLGTVGFFLRVADLFQDVRTSLSDSLAELCILIGELACLCASGGYSCFQIFSFTRKCSLDCRFNPLRTHMQIHCCRPCCPQLLASFAKELLETLNILDSCSDSLPGRQIHAIGSGAANQPSTAKMHVLDGYGHGLNSSDVLDDKFMR